MKNKNPLVFFLKAISFTNFLRVLSHFILEEMDYNKKQE